MALAALLIGSLTIGSALAQQFERADGTAFRYLSWNVSRENFLSRQAAMIDILRASGADVMMLDELPKEVDEASLTTFAANLDGGPWQVVLGKGGGAFQRSAVISRVPSRRIQAFDSLGYPATVRSRLLEGAGMESRNLEVNLSFGIPVAGAELAFTPYSVIVVGLDLQCCGNSPGSWQELRRRFETESIRATLDRSWTNQTAVIVSGDFNNVQGMMPVDNIAASKHPNPARRLQRAPAIRGDGKTDWTWDGRGTEFPSRPLDHVLHSDGLRVLNAFVLDTEHLPEATLKAHGLDPKHSITCSDHRPVIVDFAWAADTESVTTPAP